MPSANNPAGLDDFVPLSQMNLPEPESSKDKLKRKMIEEPLVPIGTCLALRPRQLVVSSEADSRMPLNAR